MATPTLTDVLAAKLDACCVQSRARRPDRRRRLPRPNPLHGAPPTAVPERARLRRGSTIPTRRVRGATLHAYAVPRCTRGVELAWDAKCGVAQLGYGCAKVSVHHIVRSLATAGSALPAGSSVVAILP